MDRQTKFQWMQDLLEHLGQCYDQWQEAEGVAADYLADNMRRDLDEFRRLFESLSVQQASSQRLRSVA